MKKKLMRFNLAALALVMVTSVLISGTFAKYTTAVSAQDTALIARWDISSDGTGMAFDGQTDLDLFGHAYNTAILNSDTVDGDTQFILGPGVQDSFTVNLTGTADVDATIDLKIVKSGTAQTAPIQYAIEKQGKTFDWGDTDTYDLYYSEHLLSEAILMKMDELSEQIDVNAERVEADITEDPIVEAQNPIILKNSESVADVNVEVHWRWPFNAGDHNQDLLKEAFKRGENWTDADDTALGIASAKAIAGEGQEPARSIYGLTITLKAEQITPTAP